MGCILKELCLRNDPSTKEKKTPPPPVGPGPCGQ